MNYYQNLLERLQAAQSEEERAWITLQFNLAKQPTTLRPAVTAAAVLHWFDQHTLNFVLETELSEAEFNALIALPYIEEFPGRGWNVHEKTRELLRDKLWKENQTRYRELSRRAAACYREHPDNQVWQAEAVFHALLAGESGAEEAFINLGIEWHNRFQYIALEALINTELNAAQAGRLSKRAIGWVMFMQSRLHLTFSRPREAKKALHLALSVDSEDQTLNANCIQALSDVRASLSELPQAGLFQKMLNAGFSSLLAHQILSEMPAGKMAGSLWVKQVLKCNLQVVDKANDVIVKGGAYALIGSTGVGKTSTIAKLAARAIVKYGADTVALLTTDSYRIGAYEQLKTYGKILGVSVHAVKDPDDLRLSLSALRHKRLVLIDTAGTGQRDERVGDQNEMFEATDVQCLLLLNATSSRDTLEDVVRRFSSSKIVGCILTKLDEAINLGSVLDVVIRHRLVLHYMANGQHVPEDLHPINFNYLLRRALTPAKEKTPPTWHELNFPKLVTGSSTKKVLCTLK